MKFLLFFWIGILQLSQTEKGNHDGSVQNAWVKCAWYLHFEINETNNKLKIFRSQIKDELYGWEWLWAVYSQYI